MFYYEVRYIAHAGQGPVPGSRIVKANSAPHAETIVRRSQFGYVEVCCTLPTTKEPTQ